MQFFFHLSIIIMTNPETSETNILGVLRRRHGAKAPGTPQEQGLPQSQSCCQGESGPPHPDPFNPNADGALGRGRQH